MPFISLSGTTGYLTIGATPVRLTANLGATTRPPAASSTANVTSHTIFIQQHAGNSSELYLLDRADGNPTTGVGVLYTLVAPFLASGDLTGLAWAAITVPYAPGGLNAADYWLVADASSQKATVAIIQA